MSVSTRELAAIISKITSSLETKYLLLYCGKDYTISIDAVLHEPSGRYMLPCTYCIAINLIDLEAMLKMSDPRFRVQHFKCFSCGKINLTVCNGNGKDLHVKRLFKDDNG